MITKRAFLVALLILFSIGLASADTYNINLQNSQTVTLNNSINPANLSSLQISVSPNYTHVNPDGLSGLVSYWKFDDLQGASASNSIQNGPTLDFSNSPSVVTGKYDNAMSTSNSRAFITDLLLGKQSCSISCWLNKSSNVTNSAIYCDYGSGNYNDLLYETSTGALTWAVGDGQVAHVTSISSNPVSVNKWHHVVVTFNGSTGEQSIYVDDIKSTRQAVATSIGSTQSECSIAYWGNSGAYFAGNIDDLALYDRSMSQDEVNQLYFNDIQGLTVKTNSNSSTATVSGLTNIPFSATDSGTTGLTFAVPSSQVIGGRIVYDYSSTVSPFTAVLTPTLILPVIPPTASQTRFNNSMWMVGIAGTLFGLVIVIMFMRIVINAFKENKVLIKELEFTMLLAIVGIGALIMGVIMIGSLATLG